MKQTKKTTGSGNSPADKRLFLFSIVVFVITCVLAALSLLPRLSPTQELSVPTGQPLPANEAITDNLTQIPNAPPLSGPLAEQVRAIETQMKACADYGPERRSQMQQHIDWLLNPASLPSSMIIALGENPNANLIKGLATYTLSDWGLTNQAADSCLVPIGKQLNQMLIAQGQPPLEAFLGD